MIAPSRKNKKIVERKIEAQISILELNNQYIVMIYYKVWLHLWKGGYNKNLVRVKKRGNKKKLKYFFG
jgi:hypothetical protein